MPPARRSWDPAVLRRNRSRRLSPLMPLPSSPPPVGPNPCDGMRSPSLTTKTSTPPPPTSWLLAGRWRSLPRREHLPQSTPPPCMRRGLARSRPAPAARTGEQGRVRTGEQGQPPPTVRTQPPPRGASRCRRASPSSFTPPPTPTVFCVVERDDPSLSFVVCWYAKWVLGCVLRWSAVVIYFKFGSQFAYAIEDSLTLRSR